MGGNLDWHHHRIIVGKVSTGVYNEASCDDNGLLSNKNYIWNTVSLAWEAATKGTGVGTTVEVENFPASYPVTGVPDDAYPAGTGVNSAVTLTSANTAYAVPSSASTKKTVLILYNGSDTNMFVGFQNTNANGILLPTGGIMMFDLGASQQLYAYCASAGKVITYCYKEVTV